MKNNDKESKWIEFMLWLGTHNQLTFYRGVSNKIEHLLLPSIGRNNYSIEKEVDLLENFKLRVNLTTPKAYTDLEWLVLAQHHGLPTRLLDWSTNPLVSAFFAVMKNSKGDYEGDGRIYAVASNSTMLYNEEEDQSPLYCRTIKFVVPPVNNKRIELQRGLFSIHPLPNEPVISTTSITPGLIPMIYAADSLHLNMSLGSVPLFQGNHSAYQELLYSKQPLYKNYMFDIPQEYKPFFEKSLRALGIDETIFGDLDSIAKHLTYQSKQNLLPRMNGPIYTVAIPFWELKINNQIVKYLELNQQVWPYKHHNILISNRVKIQLGTVTKIDNQEYKIRGTLSFNILPNFSHSFKMFDYDYNFHSKYYSYINSLYYKITQKSINTGSNFYSVDFIVEGKAQITPYNFSFDNFEFSSMHAKAFSQNIEDYGKAVELFEKIVKIISSDDLNSFKNAALSSNNFHEFNFDVMSKHYNKDQFE